MSEKQNISISPEGAEYILPTQEDYAREFDRVRQMADAAKANGQEIVVVMGVGFVGAVMAAIVADATKEEQWWEFVGQNNYPSNSLKTFFRNQKKLKDLKVLNDLIEALKGIDAFVFAVRHKAYMDLEPGEVIKAVGGPVAVIDCFGILDDRKIKDYLRLGCEVKGLGRGHIRRIKDEIRNDGGDR